MTRFVFLEGKRILDIGCGALAFTKQLAQHGATAVGIDPDPIQAAKNRELEPIANVEFVEAAADALPAEDQSFDGVTFAYSLHHVPAEVYTRMFDEIFRVLKPGGFLYVIEPTDCSGNEVMRLFHDEQQVRAEAWQALQKIARPQFETCEEVTYHSVTQYESWDHYANIYSSKSFNSDYTETDVRADKVREAYDQHAGPDNQLIAQKNAMALLTHRGRA
ncbi:MAG: class I SAM-dependent methyltransferase [Planctomycetaceae bacterium]